MPWRFAALLTVALLSAAACGDSGDEVAAPENEDEAAASVVSVTVEATDFAFDPATIEAGPGETVHVTFVNEGKAPHTFTIEELDFDHQAASGHELKAAFTAPDEDTTIEFVCRFHPEQMVGELVVGDGGSGSGGSGSDGSSEEDSDTYDY